MTVEVAVRMGEWAVSARRGDVLVAVGLGSCIGLVLVEAGAPRAGLAHVVLPQAPPSLAEKAAGAKFADRAVPLLVDNLVRLGARRARLEAVLVGGAQMFSSSDMGSGSIGERNEEAVLRALSHAGIPARARATSGRQGRTVRVDLGGCLVTVREAGGGEQTLYAWRPER